MGVKNPKKNENGSKMYILSYFMLFYVSRFTSVTSGMGVVVLRRFCSRFVYEEAKRLQNDYKTTTPYVVVLYMKRCFLRRFKSYTLNDAKRLL